MTNILHIDSSVFGEQGKSSQLAAEFVRRHTEANVIHHDLDKHPIPHLSGARFGAFTTPAEKRSAEQREVAAFSDQLIQELRDADTVVLGMPLYNLGVPSTFKAWIDHVARAGETFRYTENGPKGLLDNKKVLVFAARGGQYQGTELDTQSSYLRHIFDLMGITDIEFIYAEGLNMGDATASDALDAAREAIAAKAA